MLLSGFEVLDLLGQFGGALVVGLLFAGRFELSFEFGKTAERLGFVIDGLGLLLIEQIATGSLRGGLGLLEHRLGRGNSF